jgi:3-oxoacyl-[acyl-carrier protein] reductase
MAFDLHGQAALVFGGGDALGRAVSIALAEAGADVAVASVTHRGDEQFEVAATADAVRKAGR